MSEFSALHGQKMLDFTPSQLGVAEISEVRPGDFFIWEGRDNSALAVLLTPPGGQGTDAFLMTLAGTEAFVIHVVDPTYRDRVIPLKLDPMRLRLRFDPNGITPQLQDHKCGCMVFSTNGCGAIFASYANPRGHYGRRPLVYLDNWRIGNASEPRFAFGKWALSYRAEFGWIDLATNAE